MTTLAPFQYIRRASACWRSGSEISNRACPACTFPSMSVDMSSIDMVGRRVRAACQTSPAVPYVSAVGPSATRMSSRWLVRAFNGRKVIRTGFMRDPQSSIGGLRLEPGQETDRTAAGVAGIVGRCHAEIVDGGDQAVETAREHIRLALGRRHLAL